MKRILPFIFTFSLLSCEKVKEEALYNEYDDDWDLVQQLIASQCKNDSKIFQELTKRGDFSKYYNNNTYFEVDIVKKNADGSGQSTYKSYIRLEDITTDSMTIHYFDSLDINDSRSISFSTPEHENLVTAISNGICASDDDFEFSHSSLDSSKELDFTDTRKDGDDDDYTKQTDKYSANVNYPLPLILFSRTLEVRTKENGGSESDPAVSTWKLEEISEKKCEETTLCNNATWSYSSANFAIDPNAYLSNSTSSLFLELN